MGSESPSSSPSGRPSSIPSSIPSASPSNKPSTSPSDEPSTSPSDKPSVSQMPSQSPTIDSIVGFATTVCSSKCGTAVEDLDNDEDFKRGVATIVAGGESVVVPVRVETGSATCL